MGVLLLIAKYALLALLVGFVYAVYRVILWDALQGAERRAEPAASPAPGRTSPATRPSAVSPPRVARPTAPTAVPPVGEPRLVSFPTELPPVPESAPAAEEPTAVEQAAAAPSPEVATGPRAIVLRGTDDGGLPTGSVFRLSAATTIGRGPDNTIVLRDRYVSLEHALIYVADGKRLLRDRGSTNGTLLNGTRIHGDVPLRDGDKIEIGTVVLEYRE